MYRLVITTCVSTGQFRLLYVGNLHGVRKVKMLVMAVLSFRGDDVVEFAMNYSDVHEEGQLDCKDKDWGCIAMGVVVHIVADCIALEVVVLYQYRKYK